MVAGWFSLAMMNAEIDAAEHWNSHAKDVYRERARFVAGLASQHYSHWTIDPQAPGWRVVCVHLPAQNGFKGFTTVTWHISPDDHDLFPNMVTYTESDYDGHTTDEKYRRLEQYYNDLSGDSK